MHHWDSNTCPWQIDFTGFPNLRPSTTIKGNNPGCLRLTWPAIQPVFEDNGWVRPRIMVIRWHLWSSITIGHCVGSSWSVLRTRHAIDSTNDSETAVSRFNCRCSPIGNSVKWALLLIHCFLGAARNISSAPYRRCLNVTTANSAVFNKYAGRMSPLRFCTKSTNYFLIWDTAVYTFIVTVQFFCQNMPQLLLFALISNKHTELLPKGRKEDFSSSCSNSVPEIPFT